MRRWLSLSLAMTLLFSADARAERSVSLRGSPAAMLEQNRVALDHNLPFYRTAGEIRTAVERGQLQPLTGNEDYDVANFVAYPFLQPELVLFVERLAQQYREACGQKLVVTSGVRPINEQPGNSHPLSVHPAGMAVDLRVSDRQACRSWLEDAFLNMEAQGLLNATREYRPPHYHVAVFPREYGAYAAERMAVEEEARLAAAEIEARERLEAEALAFAAANANTVTPGSSSRRKADPLFLTLAVVVVGLGVGFRSAFKRIL